MGGDPEEAGSGRSPGGDCVAWGNHATAGGRAAAVTRGRSPGFSLGKWGRNRRDMVAVEPEPEPEGGGWRRVAGRRGAGRRGGGARGAGPSPGPAAAAERQSCAAREAPPPVLRTSDEIVT